MTNQLAQSLSPYLLQHQNNPVDWVVWGASAFETARQRDVPVFLSVGYAACHWCHVMAHECFEDEAIGRLLNERFVCIKVDREERPDIDQIYMNAVQLMTGRGGWPMSVFIDHDARPFYSGTYWPPVPRGGMPSFPQVIQAIDQAWRERREEVGQHASEMLEALQQLAIGTGVTADEVPPRSRVEVTTEMMLKQVDRTWGGFGAAPKFPHATDLLLFLQVAARTGDSRVVEAVTLTLDRMAAGGIRDHIGGGFSRYSVDGQWLVPHFEKMLYDNALLAEVYTRAFQVTGQTRHAEVAIEILEYLIRDMLDDAGGLHSSEDADSEGVEGKFYVWQPSEVVAVLGPSRGERFCAIYDITPGGNFEGHSIPNLPRSIDSWADELGVDDATLRSELADDRERLRLIRDQRIRPGRDDKVLTAWNALAIKSLAVAGAVLDRSDFVETAIRAARFLTKTMRADSGRMQHAYRAGTAHLLALVDDLALTVDALVSLYEATADGRWITIAVELADQMRMHFEDTTSGGFFYTADDAETLLTRNKDWHDGSLVSGNAAAAGVLLRLASLTGLNRFRESAAATLRAGDLVMQKQSLACAALVAALDRWHGTGDQWVVAVDSRDTFAEIRPRLFARFHPHRTVAWVTPEAGTPLAQSPLDPALLEGRTASPHRCVVYRCENETCETPAVDPDAAFWR